MSLLRQVKDGVRPIDLATLGGSALATCLYLEQLLLRPWLTVWLPSFGGTLGGLFVAAGTGGMLYWLRRHWLRPRYARGWRWLAYTTRLMYAAVHPFVHSLASDFGPSPRGLKTLAARALRIFEIAKLLLDTSPPDRCDDESLTKALSDMRRAAAALRARVYDPLNGDAENYDQAEEARRLALVALIEIDTMVSTYWYAALLRLPRDEATQKVQELIETMYPKAKRRKSE